MFGLGIWELIIVLTIVVLLFGAKKLPMIGEGLGKMITNFKKESNLAKESDQNLDGDKEKIAPKVVNEESSQN